MKRHLRTATSKKVAKAFSESDGTWGTRDGEFSFSSLVLIRFSTTVSTAFLGAGAGSLGWWDGVQAMVVTAALQVWMQLAVADEVAPTTEDSVSELRDSLQSLWGH